MVFSFRVLKNKDKGFVFLKIEHIFGNKERGKSYIEMGVLTVMSQHYFFDGLFNEKVCVYSGEWKFFIKQ